MLLHSDYIDPAELTGYVRAALADEARNGFDLAQWLPHRFVNDLDYRFTRGGEGLTEAATFRTYDTESPIGSRPGVTRVSGELPPISRKIRLGEYARLRQRANGGNEEIVAGLLSDAERMSRAVAARLELARGDALVNGTVTISENGVEAVVDFGRDASHTVAAGTVWTDTTNGTVLSDLVAWYDTYVATNGEPPEAVLTSTKVARLMQRNAEVINAIAGSASGRTRVTRAELDALLESEGLPGIFINDARVRVDGTASRVISEDHILMLPAPVGQDDPDGTDLGASLWGTTAESLEPEYGLEGEEPGVVAGVYSTKDPVALWTKAAGIGLPVLANPNLSLAGDVA
jgi:hypothetical protein